MRQKTLVLFSGGKDSFYALQKAREDGPVELVVSVLSHTGDTQLHAGPEVNESLRKAQIELLGMPHGEVVIGSGDGYLHELFAALNHIVKEHNITHLVTGDLWHPYTSGIGDMLAGALGVTLVRPAREVCPTPTDDVSYMSKVLDAGIESVIVSVRNGSLPETFIGRKIDHHLVRELQKMKVDAAAEGGEYQSFVTAAPVMHGSIVIDDFSVSVVPGKNGREQFHRMNVNAFHIESTVKKHEPPTEVNDPCGRDLVDG